jgi:acetyl-CoA carboxylase biotin carboxylase subunit
MKKIAQRILISNRGEIAIRIAKAVHELGHIPIGLYTQYETNAFHLEFCSEHILLEGNSNRETYLNIPQIIKICLEHKIDAVHPGYGFLAENMNFATELQKNGIVFIGPNPHAIDAMGDKAKSKQLAVKAGVPVVPGSTGEVADIKEALSIAKNISYPVLLKAVAGGGGKGMRICNNDDDIKNNFESVQREALSSFGYAGLLVEKYITNPHHIEVQILGAKDGRIFHLFERECSIQRRHQKIIEEAPSPFIGTDHQLRLAICDAAVKLAKAVNYDSAGTVEFIMGDDKKFYFLEMNTRIQVEHPITEEITGIDLVANMIKAAFKDPLDFQSQDDIKIRGHAIEARICAEDPVSMLPAPGTVHGFSYSLTSSSRFDHCIYPGYEVKSDFDPMIGKMISVGFNRSIAIRKMNYNLENLMIDGMLTNIELLKLILKNSDFIEGHYTTKFIETFKDEIKTLSYTSENHNSIYPKIAATLSQKIFKERSSL